MQINQQTICKFHAVEGIKKYELIYLNNLCYVDLGKDLKELAIQQYVYAYHFFKYLENSNIQNKNLLNAFEIHYGTSWKRYVLTLISARTISIKHAGRLEKTLECDIDNLMEKSVFDHLKLDTSKEMKYASSSKEDREGNSDYRYFRQSPIIDDSDSYILYSSPLFLGKVYNSLYFDLPKINKEILEKQNRVSSIKDLITTDFVQNTLLYGYIKESIHSGYEMYTEARMEALYVKKENELGAPDLVLISHRHAILFECKDIRLNGWVKEQKDYNLIMQELKEKEDYIIRFNRIEDQSQMAKIKVNGWRNTYKEIVDKEYLEKLNVEEQTQKYFRSFEEYKDRVLVAVKGKEVLGYACFDPKEKNFKYDSELVSLYIKEEYQRKGIGKALFTEATKELTSRNKRNMILWVFTDNKNAITFYKKLGGIISETRQAKIGNKTYKEFGFYYDLESLDKEGSF